MTSNFSDLKSRDNTIGKLFGPLFAVKCTSLFFSEVKGISAKHLQSLSLNLRLIPTLVLTVKRHFKMPVEVGFQTDKQPVGSV